MVASRGSAHAAAAEDRRYRLFFEASPLAKFIVDLESRRILEVNQAAIDLYGYSRDELVSMSFTQLADDGDREALTDALANAQRPFRSARTWCHRRKDGSHVYQVLTWHELPWEGHQTCLVAAIDVTDREQKTRELRETNARLRAVLHTAMESVVLMDEAGRIREFNPAAEEMFGFEAQAVIGRPLDGVIIPEEHRERYRAGLRRSLAGGTPEVIGHHMEMEAIRAGGETFPVELRVAAHIDEGGTWFTAFFRDITHRRVEQEQLEITENLEKEVVAGTQRLEAVNKELEAFAYSVSHDLRAPLRAIDGFSQALLDDVGGQLDEQARHYLNRVRAATQRMGRLIDDLLGLSRVSRQEVNRQKVDLSQMALEVADELRESAPERDVELAIQPGLAAWADADLVWIVLQNLLSNAWKYTAYRERARIEVGETSADGESAIFVRDNGAGFDMRYADKLFGAFQRLHSSSEFEGTGIGLATVQRVINLHGGRVWAEGEVDRGATFYFTLGKGEIHG